MLRGTLSTSPNRVFLHHLFIRHRRSSRQESTSRVLGYHPRKGRAGRKPHVLQETRGAHELLLLVRGAPVELLGYDVDDA